MSTHLIIRNQCLSDSVCLTLDEPPGEPVHTASARIQTHNCLLGVVGVIVVGVILGLSVYSVMKYLL